MWAGDLRPVALSTSITALVDSVAEFFAPAPPPSPGEVVEVGTAVAEAALFLFTMLAIVFFWLVEHARLQRYTLAFLPADRRAGARNAWNEIETRLGPVGPRAAHPHGRDGRRDRHSPTRCWVCREPCCSA